VIFLGLFAVAAFAIGGQSIPIFLEYQAISKASTKAARENSTVPDIRAAFDELRPSTTSDRSLARIWK
jgi:hypothetical protein